MTRSENTIVMFFVAAAFAFAGYYFGYRAGFDHAADICIAAIQNAQKL